MTCAQDLDVELAKLARRNVAPPAQPDDSSDRSEETGIASLEAGATDAVPALAPAAQSAAKRAKSKAAPAVKASAGGCDVDSAKALKVAKPTASVKKTAQAAPAKAEEVAPRQRPTNNQLLCVLPPSPLLRHLPARFESDVSSIIPAPRACLDHLRATRVAPSPRLIP